MPRAHDWRRAGEREAHQLPDQHRRRDERRHRRAGRRSAAARVREERHHPRMGNPAGGQAMSYHVAVLMGGWANERPVSLMSGEGVAKALEARGHRVTRIDMDRTVAARIAEAAPDVVFNALHGVPGEDGTVQGMLDLMGVPYTHSGLASSVIAIDKELTKNALVPHGVPMPGGRIVESEGLYEKDPLARPY